jgi:putative DNA primase/helicase
MRMCLIAWTVTIPIERQDPELKTKLEAEAAGILRWIVEGCLAWQQGGLQPPKAVLDATEEYRRESNPIGDFLDDRCTRDPIPGKEIARVLAKPLYEAFKTWCEDNGRNVVSQKALGDALTTLGYQRKPYGGVTSYVGLRLVEPGEVPLDPQAPDPEGSW